MAKVTFIRPDGTHIAVDAETGESLMQTATRMDIDGILAECGGNAMCATCHVYIEARATDQLPAMDDSEEEMLQCTAAERTPESRLSCQIPVSEALDGLVVRLPETQT
jgi:ferredoxin, 2Fe-2S